MAIPKHLKFFSAVAVLIASGAQADEVDDLANQYRVFNHPTQEANRAAIETRLVALNNQGNSKAGEVLESQVTPWLIRDFGRYNDPRQSAGRIAVMNRMQALGPLARSAAAAIARSLGSSDGNERAVAQDTQSLITSTQFRGVVQNADPLNNVFDLRLQSNAVLRFFVFPGTRGTRLLENGNVVVVDFDPHGRFASNLQRAGWNGAPDDSEPPNNPPRNPDFDNGGRSPGDVPPNGNIPPNGDVPVQPPFGRIGEPPIMPVVPGNVPRLISRDVRPDPPLPPVTLVLESSSTEEVIVAVDDTRDPNGSYQERILPGGSVKKAFKRDSGATVVERYAVGGPGSEEISERTYHVSPRPRYKVTVYENRVQYSYIDRRPRKDRPKGSLENFDEKAAVGIGTFGIPAGAALTSGTLDVYRAAVSQRNSGAAR